MAVQFCKDTEWQKKEDTYTIYNGIEMEYKSSEWEYEYEDKIPWVQREQLVGISSLHKLFLFSFKKMLEASLSWGRDTDRQYSFNDISCLRNDSNSLSMNVSILFPMM